MRASSSTTSSTRRARCWSDPLAYGQRVAARGFAMFSLQEIRRAHEVVLQALAPDTGAELAAPRRAARRRGRGQAREPSADRRLQGARRPHLRRRADQARAGDARVDFGDARQSWPEPRLRRAARRASGDDPRAAGQFDREKRRHARARRRIDRVRARLSGGARGGDAARERARSAPGSVVPPRSGARRLDLRVRASERTSGPRRALRSDRSGLGNLRLHRGARRSGSQDRDRRRAIDGSAGLLAFVRRRPCRAHQQRRHARRRHGDPGS